VKYLLAAGAAALTCFGAALKSVPACTTAASASDAVAEFSMVGEYLSLDGKFALQATLLPDQTFLTAQYRGGLPGDGWDQSPIISSTKTAGELKTKLKGFQRVERQSPTLGKPQPADAILRFPEDFTQVKNGIMRAGAKTRKNIGSFHMHLEFMIPFKPARNLSNQDRGNSGIYIFNNYEIQILDSFALDFNHPENNANKIESSNMQWCGALYKTKTPDLNMTYPPLCWQTYDIDFKAPIFAGDKKVKNARITVRHNGVLIHDDVELKNGTGNGAKKRQLSEGPVFFQNHGNPVQFRNVWASELK